MPSFIVKPLREENYYVIWSTVVDAPTYWGTREELQATPWLEATNERFDRADARGTSMIDGSLYGWDEEWFILSECFFELPDLDKGHYRIYRDKIRAYCEREDVGEDPLDLLVFALHDT